MRQEPCGQEEIMEAIFGVSDDENESDFDHRSSEFLAELPRDLNTSSSYELVIAADECQWKNVQGIPGLWVCPGFLPAAGQNWLVDSITKEGWFQSPQQNQAMRFGRLPPWAQDLSTFILEAALETAKDDSAGELQGPVLPLDILNQRPIFNQMIANSYEPGEGIRPHVDLMRFHDGIAIVSLLSECVMTFSRVPDSPHGTSASSSEPGASSASPVASSDMHRVLTTEHGPSIGTATGPVQQGASSTTAVATSACASSAEAAASSACGKGGRGDGGGKTHGDCECRHEDAPCRPKNCSGCEDGRDRGLANAHVAMVDANLKSQGMEEDAVDCGKKVDVVVCDCNGRHSRPCLEEGGWLGGEVARQDLNPVLMDGAGESMEERGTDGACCEAVPLYEEPRRVLCCHLHCPHGGGRDDDGCVGGGNEEASEEVATLRAGGGEGEVNRGANVDLGSGGTRMYKDFDVQSGGETKHVLLAPGDLLLMYGEARYKWTHCIRRDRETQQWEGRELVQKRRWSITLRRLIGDDLGC